MPTHKSFAPNRVEAISQFKKHLKKNASQRIEVLSAKKTSKYGYDIKYNVTGKYKRK